MAIVRSDPSPEGGTHWTHLYNSVRVAYASYALCAIHDERYRWKMNETKWGRVFGGVLVGGPMMVGVIVSVISGQLSAVLLSAIIFLAPMLLGAWLLLRRPPD
jgi:hypothetical protein